MLSINSEAIYDDEPSDMTLGRRLALHLSQCSWYNVASKLESVERITITDHGTDVVSVRPPNLVVGWEFFEHQMLPRSIAKMENNYKKKEKNVSYQRVEPGQQNKNSKLYPIWNTPLRDLGGFGLAVGLYFSLLLFFSVLLFFTGCINIPNMVSFWNAYDELNSNTTHYTLRTSAICSNTSWAPCPSCLQDVYKEYVSADRIAFANDNDDLLPFILKNNCDLPPGFGVFTSISIGFVFIAMYIFMYFQSIKASEMNSDPTSSGYSIQITNPPPKAKDPDEWKAFFETKFEGVKVNVCTVVVDNEALIRKLVRRRQLLLELENSLPREIGLDVKNLNELVGEAWEPHIFTKLFCCRKNIKVLIQNIHDLEEKINVLGQQNYDVSGVFITFEREENQQRILKALQAPLSCMGKKEQNLMFKEISLNVNEPAEPSSIRWDDLEEGPLLKFCERFVSFVVSIIIIVSGFYIILGAKELGPVSVSITITVMNEITPSLVQLISRFESHNTRGSYTASIYLKVTAIRWINTAIVLWLLNPFTDTIRDGEYLLATVRNIFIAEIVQRPILQLSDLPGQLKRHYFAPRAPDQRRMNAAFMPRYFEIGERYTEITKVLFLTFFYATLMPASFFYAAAIFFVYFWVDKFCILRTWRQAPLINSTISTLSMYLFLMTLVAYAVMASYSIAQYPFDNACVDLESSSIEYVGIYTVQTLKNGTDSFEVTVENNSPSYKFCDQNIMRYSNISFPAFPRYQPEGKEWMTDSQEDLSTFFGWIAIFILSTFSITVFARLLRMYVSPLIFKMTKTRAQNSDRSFDNNMPGYVPQIYVPEFCYPQLICKINSEQRSLVGWVDINNKDYRFHNMIYDVKRRGKHSFSSIKSWSRVTDSQS